MRLRQRNKQSMRNVGCGGDPGDAWMRAHLGRQAIHTQPPLVPVLRIAVCTEVRPQDTPDPTRAGSRPAYKALQPSVRTVLRRASNVPRYAGSSPRGSHPALQCGKRCGWVGCAGGGGGGGGGGGAQGGFGEGRDGITGNTQWHHGVAQERGGAEGWDWWARVRAAELQGGR